MFKSFVHREEGYDNVISCGNTNFNGFNENIKKNINKQNYSFLIINGGSG